jgi:hypothetical protein
VPTDPHRGEAAERAFREAWTGHFHGCARLLEAFAEQPGPLEHAWSAALRAIWSLAEPHRVSGPDSDQVSAALGRDESTRRAAARACAQMERAALVSMDGAEADRWIGLHGQLLEGASERSPWLWLEFARLWRQLQWGQPSGVPEALSALQSEATEHGESPLVIETAAVRALAMAAHGDLEQAVASARRASRMAATEGMPAPEYLANLVLARIRRLRGKPHLAARILTGLARVVPPVWRGWLTLELVLASGRDGFDEASASLEEPGGNTPAARGAAHLGSLLDAASQGDRERMQSSADGVMHAVADWQAMAVELSDGVGALDWSVEPAALTTEMRAWCVGEQDPPPPAARGVCTPEGTVGEGESAVAWVVAGHGAARRIARPGLNLFLQEVGGVSAMPQTRRKSGRTDKALAALGLVGEQGMTGAALFQSAYGFAYSPSIHQEVLRVLIHRARTRLGEAGQLVHSSGHVRLIPARPLAVPDPRCSQPVDDRVLRWLARRGRASAQDVARQCKISLRAAQAALQQLTSEGACAKQRDGRKVEYRVEDTTYSEPTQY